MEGTRANEEARAGAGGPARKGTVLSRSARAQVPRATTEDRAVDEAPTGWAGAVAGLWLHSMFGNFTGYLASPFVLYYLYYLFSSDVRGLGDAMRSRQHFREQLEIATNNPHDADARAGR